MIGQHGGKCYTQLHSDQTTVSNRQLGSLATAVVICLYRDRSIVIAGKRAPTGCRSCVGEMISYHGPVFCRSALAREYGASATMFGTDKPHIASKLTPTQCRSCFGKTISYHGPVFVGARLPANTVPHPVCSAQTNLTSQASLCLLISVLRRC